MKKIYFLYMQNKKNSKINIFALIFSIVLCFMLLSFAEQKKQDESIINIKSQNVKYNFPKINEKIIKELKNDKNIEYFYLSYLFPKEFEKFFEEEFEENMERFMISFYENNTKNNDLINFKQIKIPKKLSLKKDFKIGDFLKINEEKLDIIDYTDSNLLNSFIISLETAQYLNLEIESANIVFDKNISDKMFEDRINKFLNFFDVKEYELGNSMKLPIESTAMFSLSLLILISVLNVAFIFINILLERKKMYFIYRFFGMKKSQFYKIVLFEIVLDFVISFTISTLIFIALNEIFIKNILGIMRYQFRYKFIIYVFLTYFLIYIVLMYFSLKKYFAKSLIMKYKE